MTVMLSLEDRAACPAARRVPTRTHLVRPLGVIALALTASCTTCDPPTPGGPMPPTATPPDLCGPGPTLCMRNIDCNAGMICTKPDDANATTDPGCCLAVRCTSDDDCTPPARCDTARAFCAEEEVCRPLLDGTGCPSGQLCVHEEPEVIGMCIPEDDLPPVASCELHPAVVHAATGVVLPVRALPLTAEGRPVLYRDVELQSDLLGAAQGTQCAGPDVCEGTVTGSLLADPGDAASATITCSAQLRVYPTLDPNLVRAIVIDELGAPIEGAEVRFVLDSGPVDVVTDELGVALTAVGGGTVFAVTAAAAGYEALTLVTDDQTAMRDTLLPLGVAPDPSATYRAWLGRVDDDELLSRGDILIGLGGLAVERGPAGLRLDDVMGRSVIVSLDIEGVTAGPTQVSLPGSGILGIAAIEAKDLWVAPEPRPRPNDAPALGWALAARASLADVGAAATALFGGTDDPFVGIETLGALLHVQQVGVAPVSTETTELESRSDGTVVLSQPAGSFLPLLTPHVFSAFLADVDVPDLPCPQGRLDDDAPARACESHTGVDGMIMMVVVDVPGRGLVPVGLGVAPDDPVDDDDENLVDGIVDADGLPKGILRLPWASPPGGLEGGKLRVVALAYGTPSIADQLPISTISLPLENGDDLEEFGRAFPEVPFAALDDGDSLANASLQLDPVDEADVLDVRLDTGGNPWRILLEVGAPVPANLDLLLSSPPSGEVRLTALRALVLGLLDDPASLSTLNARNLDRLDDFAEGAAHARCTTTTCGAPL